MLQPFITHTAKRLMRSPIAVSTAILSLCVLLSACSRPVVQASMSEGHPYADSSFDFSMFSYIGNDTIHYGSSRIRWTKLNFPTSDGHQMRVEIWFPVGRHTDSAKVAVLIPGLGDQPMELYPIAMALTREGMVALVFSPRGVGRDFTYTGITGIGINSGLPFDYGVHLPEDVTAALSAYQRNYHLQQLSVSAFGTSLGAVTALDLAANDDQIHGAVLESVMPNLSVTAHKLLSSSDYQEMDCLLRQAGRSLADYNPTSTIKRFPVRDSLLGIWGQKDKLISQDEQMLFQREIEQSIPHARFERIKNGGHGLTYGFPLSEQQALSLDKQIAAFMVRSVSH